MRLTDIAELVLLAALWGASFLFMRNSAAEFGPVALIALRVGLASSLLLLWLAYLGKLTQLRHHWKKLLVLGVINSLLPFLLFAWAMQNLNAGVGSILNATAPLWGAIIASFWLGDRLSNSRKLGLVIACAGVTLLVWDRASFGGVTGLVPVGACLLATFLYGIGSSFAKRFCQGIDPNVNATGSQLAAALFLLPAVLFFLPSSSPSLKAWSSAIALAVFSTALAYALFFRLISNIGPSRTITVTFLIPVFGLLFGWYFLNEKITALMSWGALIALVGTFFALGLGASIKKTK